MKPIVDETDRTSCPLCHKASISLKYEYEEFAPGWVPDAGADYQQ
jgi:hypothetical protein